MRGVKLTSLTLLIALIASCLISVPVLSGEHPWDSDSQGGGTANTTASPNNGRAQLEDNYASSKLASDPMTNEEKATVTARRGWRSYGPMSLFFRVTYMAAEKLHAKMYGSGRMGMMQAGSAGR